MLHDLNWTGIHDQVDLWILHCVCIELIPICIHIRARKSIKRNNEGFIMKPFRWDQSSNSIAITFLFSLLNPSFIAKASYEPSLILIILNDTSIQIISVAAIFLQFENWVTHNFNYFRADWFHNLSRHGSIHGCCRKCNSWNVYKPKLSDYSNIQFSPAVTLGKTLIGLFSDFSNDSIHYILLKK